MDRHYDLATAEDSLLLVIDPQEKLVKMIHNRDEVVPTISMLIKFASIFKIPVVLTEHYPKGLGFTVDEIKENLPAYQPIVKRIFGCFGLPEFAEAIEATGRKRLLVVGIETHICVCQTVLDAMHRGYQVHVVADGTGTRKREDHEIALARMQHAGAVVTTSEALMYEVTERADTEEFKLLLELVK
jgi:nicotinamidase-related amidase